MMEIGTGTRKMAITICKRRIINGVGKRKIGLADDNFFTI